MALVPTKANTCRSGRCRYAALARPGALNSGGTADAPIIFTSQCVGFSFNLDKSRKAII